MLHSGSEYKTVKYTATLYKNTELHRQAAATALLSTFKLQTDAEIHFSAQYLTYTFLPNKLTSINFLQLKTEPIPE